MDTLQEICDLFEKHENEAREKLPEVLSIQKKKFLIAINKMPDESFSEEEEQLVKHVMDELYLMYLMRLIRKPTLLSLQWDDSKASECVKETLQKHGAFKLSKYLDCAELVFLAYSGGDSMRVYDAMEYVLTHARQFGDSAKCIFLTERQRTSGGEVSPGASPAPRPPLPAARLMRRVGGLLEELRAAYHDDKYTTLNVNATYFTLLMLRRTVKKEAELSAALKRIQTHDTYVKLCPRPLDNQLPTCDTRNLNEALLKKSAHLAIDAYLKTDDEQTKRVLRATCVQYMEWSGLQLPNLLFKVVELYGIEAAELWDLLSSESFAEALVNLADDYYVQFKQMKAVPSRSQRWFPYCRVLNGNYHRSLSAAENTRLCITLAYLVDLKVGFDLSNVSLSHWVTSSSYRKECERTATELYEKINNK